MKRSAAMTLVLVAIAACESAEAKATRLREAQTHAYGQVFIWQHRYDSVLFAGGLSKDPAKAKPIVDSLQAAKARLDAADRELAQFRSGK